jgi:hypothetical protein
MTQQEKENAAAMAAREQQDDWHRIQMASNVETVKFVHHS